MTSDRIVVGAALLSALSALTACSTTSVEPREFVIAIDSVAAPLEVAADQPLVVRLFGRVGPNGCYRLNRVESFRESGRVSITAIGEETRASGGNCTAAPVALAGDSVVVAPPFQDPFTVRVARPGGAPGEGWDTRTVRVRTP